MSFSNYEQSVIINGHNLLGVQSVNGSYGITEKPIKVAGVGFIDAVSDSPLQGNFSISRKMVGEDPLLETNSLGKYLFDEEEIEGVIVYDGNNKGFGFTKGRVSRYSVNCRVGEIPEIQTDIVVYGNLGKDVLKNNFSYPQDTSSEYYPFDLGNYTEAIVYLGQSLDQYIITEEWNAGSFQINSSQYESLPSITQFRRRGDIKWIVLGKDSFTELPYSIVSSQDKVVQYPNQSSIKLSVSDFSIDAVLDFSYSRSINTIPVYAIHKGGVETWNNNQNIPFPNLDPVQIDTEYPIETEITVTMIADEYQIREMKDRLQNAPKSELTIEILDAVDSSKVINKFEGKNVRLISESINSSVEDELNISLSYKSYESYHNEV